MNNDDLILTELRKISAWADMQRKYMKWSLTFLAIFFPTMGIIGFLVNRKVEETVTRVNQKEWYDVEIDVREGNFDKAIQIGEELIIKTPNYPEAHRQLADAYLAAGKLDKAREHYAEAFRLFPSDGNEKLLAAIDKRIQSGNTKP